MNYIYPTPNPGGSFPAPQSIAASGLLAFPDEFMSVFYPEDKQAAGFVTITHDGETVTDCQWNEEAYQAYLASLPEPEEPSEDPNPPATLEELQKKLTETQARLDAATRSTAMLEDCVAEMAEIVYA